MSLARIALPFLLLAIPFDPSLGHAEDWSLTRTAAGIQVLADGKLVTEYRCKSESRPVLYPLRSPSGKSLTRGYPLETIAGEEQDHVHQRSFWFGHGDVNGIDFWSEEPGHGTIEHRHWVRVDPGPPVRLVSQNDWLGPDGKRQLTDERRITVSRDDSANVIDFEIDLVASDGPVSFGDTKEGTLGVRVASPLRGDAQPSGTIRNSAGQINSQAWGQAAGWVDYSGTLGDAEAGITIMNHPQSFRYPASWHVRTYGLFAANPFGDKAFGRQQSGAFRLETGESLSLKFRLILHDGIPSSAVLVDWFAGYAVER